MLVIDDIEAEPYLRAVNPQFAAFVKRSRLQALCVVRLAVANAVLGAVVVGRDRPTGGFGALDQALMTQVADWATLAMLNARLAEDARASQARFSRAFERPGRRGARQCRGEPPRPLPVRERRLGIRMVQVSLHPSGERLQRVPQARPGDPPHREEAQVAGKPERNQ